IDGASAKIFGTESGTEDAGSRDAWGKSPATESLLRRCIFDPWPGEAKILQLRRNREEKIFSLRLCRETYIEKNSSQPRNRGSEWRMRFLPVFLDLNAGPVLLVGAGDLARAKLRVLISAGAHVRYYAVDGDQALHGFEPADVARIELAHGDP